MPAPLSGARVYLDRDVARRGDLRRLRGVPRRGVPRERHLERPVVSRGVSRSAAMSKADSSPSDKSSRRDLQRGIRLRWRIPCVCLTTHRKRPPVLAHNSGKDARFPRVRERRPNRSATHAITTKDCLILVLPLCPRGEVRVLRRGWHRRKHGHAARDHGALPHPGLLRRVHPRARADA